MGNSKSTSTTQSRLNPTAIRVFNSLSNNEVILTRDIFVNLFKYHIGELLWKNFYGSADSVNDSKFAEHFFEISELEVGKCVELFPSIFEFFNCCLNTVDSELTENDKTFIGKLEEDTKKTGGIVPLLEHSCPSLYQNTILRIIRDVIAPSPEKIIFTVESNILSPLQMVLLQGSLPEMVYFQNKQSNMPCWTRLYDSHTHGLSVNGFEGKVFGYSSPTVAIFKLDDGNIYAIALNVEWKHTTKFLGSSLCKCLSLEPHFKIFDSRHTEPVFCNFKFRTSAFGLGFKDVFKVNNGFENVSAIEVWGCGNQTTLQEQQTQKMRQRMTAEQRQKVPMPGNWDENPDKVIMEMAGFQFSAERNRPEPPFDDEQ